MENKKPFTVFIEGNIASGKTNFLDHFRKFDKALVLEEDIESWKNFHGINLLDLKLKNPDYFQFPFQSYATLTRLRQHLKDSETPIKIMERSLFSARRCFVEAVKSLNLLHDGMYYVLQEWYDYIDEYHEIKCDLFIYIQTDPKLVFKRINSRGRKEESDITLDYVKEIHKKHEEVFVEKADLLPAKVLVIDGNLSQDEMIEQFKNYKIEVFNE